jgi:hypothetical protein
MKIKNYPLKCLTFFLILVFSTARSQTFTAAMLQSGESCTNLQNVIAKNSANEMFAFWRDGSTASNNTQYYILKWNAVANTWTQVSTFTMTDVASQTPFANANDDVSLAIDASGGYHIVFRAIANTACCSQARGIVYGYSATGATWTFTALQSLVDSNGWLGVDDPMLDLDLSGNPHVVYQYSDANGSRYYALEHRWKSGGVWQFETILSNTGASNEITALDFDISSNGDLHAACVRETDGSGLDGSLWYAVKTAAGSSWTTTALLTGTSTAAASTSLSLQTTPSNYVSIINRDNAGNLTEVTNATGSWVNNSLGITGSINSHAYCITGNSTGDKIFGYKGASTTSTYSYAVKTAGSSSWTTGGTIYADANLNVARYFSVMMNNSGKFITLFDRLPAGGSCGTTNSREMWYSYSSIAVGAPLAATQSQVNVLCNGQCTGSASVVASGGTAPYTYSWAPSGGTGATATGRCAGSYTVTVTDAASATLTRTYTITQPPALTATTSQTNVSCNGICNGSGMVSPSGGTSPYTYSWAPSGGTGATASALCAGTYTTTITDANGCSITRNHTITQPPALVLNPQSQTNIACNGGSTGAATVNAATGGVAGYTYNWTPGNPTGDGSTSVTGLSAGTWTCTVTDANSCTATRTFNVTAPSAITVSSASQTNVSTFGGNNGAASINTPTGGVGGYTYNWTPGNPTGDGSTSVTGLTAGTWTCTVTDANGCTAAQMFTITQPSAPGAALHLDGADDRVNAGSAISTVLDAASAITVEAWVYPTDADAFGCIVGNYNTSAGGMQFLLRRDGSTYTFWTDRGTGFTNVSTPAVVAFSTWQHVAGVWNSATQTMQIYVNGVLQGTTTGVAGTTLTASANPVMIGWNSINEQMQGAVDEVRIWNRALCQSEISNNRNCEIPTTGSGLLANYHFNQGTASASNPTETTLNDASGNAYNGTLLGFTLNGATSNWITPGGVVTGTSCGAFTAPGVTVTTVSQTNVSCFSGSNGAASVSASGGSGFIYNWTPGNPGGDGTASVTGLTAGTWTCTVTNSCGASNTATFTITQPTSSVSGTTVVTNVACFGGNTGAINLTPNGGTGPYTFNWLPSGPTTEDRTGLVQGTYTVQITDVNGCTGTVNASVTQPTSPVSGTTVVTNVACFGGNTGAINLTPNGGTGPYTFNWLPSGPTTEDRTGLVQGTYTVQITDVNGCTGTVNASVTQPTSPVSGTTVVTNVACFGGNTGAINLTPNGGTGPYTFNWLPSGPTTEDRTGLVQGTYTVQITDANGCTGTVNASVTQPTSPVSGTTVVTNVACFGGNTGAINLTPNGGTGPYTFNWLPSGPTTEDRTGLVQGTYTVQITDANGCTGTVSASVTQPTSPVSGTTVVTNVACAGLFDGQIDLTPTGGVGPYTFNWGMGIATEDRGGLTANTYTVQITDANGCTATISATVTEPSPLVVNATSTPVLCNGETADITISATGGTGPFSGIGTFTVSAGTYNYSVTDANNCISSTSITVTEPTGLTVTSSAATILCNGGTADITVNATGGTGSYTGTGTFTLTAGTYTYTVTDANNCSGTTTITVTEPDALIASSSATTVLCNGGTADITVTATGGTGTLTGTGTFTVTAGTYTYTVTDANNCSATTSITVAEPAAIIASSSATTILCNGGTADITVTATGGTGTLTGTGTFTVTAGTYTYTVTDANNCSATTSITVAEPAAIIASSSATAILCNGGTADITVTATGGTGTLTGTGTFTVTAGTYTYTVTDANNCSANTSITVAEPSAIDVTTTTSGVTITANNSGAASYQWMDCNTNTIIATETSQSFTALVDGNYAVIINDGTCSDTSACVTILGIGTIEYAKNNLISVYPNPNNGVFTIQASVKGTYKIVNELGQVVFAVDLNAVNNYSASVDGLSNGVYFITGYNNHQVVNQKIVVTE